MSEPESKAPLKLTPAQYSTLKRLEGYASVVVFKKDDGTIDRSISYPVKKVDKRVFKGLRKGKLICPRKRKDLGTGITFFTITDKGRAALEEYKPPKKRRRTK